MCCSRTPRSRLDGRSTYRGSWITRRRGRRSIEAPSGSWTPAPVWSSPPDTTGLSRTYPDTLTEALAAPFRGIGCDRWEPHVPPCSWANLTVARASRACAQAQAPSGRDDLRLRRSCRGSRRGGRLRCLPHRPCRRRLPAPPGSVVWRWPTTPELLAHRRESGHDDEWGMPGDSSVESRHGQRGSQSSQGHGRLFQTEPHRLTVGARSRDQDAVGRDLADSVRRAGDRHSEPDHLPTIRERDGDRRAGGRDGGGAERDGGAESVNDVRQGASCDGPTEEESGERVPEFGRSESHVGSDPHGVGTRREGREDDRDGVERSKQRWLSIQENLHAGSGHDAMGSLDDRTPLPMSIVGRAEPC